MKKIILVSFLALILSSCASNRSSSNVSEKPTNINKAQRIAPKTSVSDWSYLGISDDNNFSNEISHKSIKKISKNIYEYQGMKTVLDTSSYVYGDRLPKFKYNISTWNINCKTKEYKIKSVDLYDIKGNLMKNYKFSNTRWHDITKEFSNARMQYRYVCGK